MNETTGISLNLSSYQPDAEQLKGRNILITGAGDGIGRALAIGFARYGATVILLGRKVKKLETVYDEIENAGYPQPAIYPLDLEKAPNEAFDQLGQVLAENFQQLDGVIHNAAILGAHTPMVLVEPQIWQRVIQTNLTAPYLITRSCYPLLKAAPSASLIFTTDAVAQQGRAYWGPYAVTKAGLDNFMQILADEWENNTSIRVNSLDPGPVLTLLRRQAFPGENPDALPTPEDSLLPFLYLIDGQHHALRGQRLRWDRQAFSLSGI
jgi:NAD(P)-dependent dehydrogenase (short-subunit alcohol dehydrogenase family)